MKIAVVSSVPLFPKNAGNRARIMSLCQGLKSAGHDVYFFYLDATNYEIDIPPHSAFFGEGQFLRVSGRSKALQLILRFMRFFRNKVFSFLRLTGSDLFFYSSLDSRFPGFISHEVVQCLNDFDCVCVEYVFNSKILDGVNGDVLKVIDTHDVFGDRHKVYSEKGLRDGFWVSLRPQDEIQGLLRADRVIGIQREEADYFDSEFKKLKNSRLQRGHCESLPSVHLLSHFIENMDPVEMAEGCAGAVFVGSNNPSNGASVNYFIENIFPEIRRILPTFQFYVIGDVCKVMPDSAGIKKLGRVGSVRSIFEKCPLMVNPMVVGTGVNIKVLEAFGYGVPIVSTKTGVRGLSESYVQGISVVEDNDFQTFAKEVVDLCGSYSRRSALGRENMKAANEWNRAQMHHLDNVFRKA